MAALQLARAAARRIQSGGPDVVGGGGGFVDGGFALLGLLLDVDGGPFGDGGPTGPTGGTGFGCGGTGCGAGGLGHAYGVKSMVVLMNAYAPMATHLRPPFACFWHTFVPTATLYCLPEMLSIVTIPNTSAVPMLVDSCTPVSQKLLVTTRNVFVAPPDGVIAKLVTSGVSHGRKRTDTVYPGAMVDGVHEKARQLGSALHTAFSDDGHVHATSSRSDSGSGSLR